MKELNLEPEALMDGGTKGPLRPIPAASQKMINVAANPTDGWLGRRAQETADNAEEKNRDKRRANAARLKRFADAYRADRRGAEDRAAEAGPSRTVAEEEHPAEPAIPKPKKRRGPVSIDRC